MTKIFYTPALNGSYLLLITGRNSLDEQEIWNKLDKARVHLSEIRRSNQKPTEITVHPGENTDVLGAITALGAEPFQAAKPAAKTDVPRPRT